MELVFIHLGEQLPKYLIKNIIRHHQIFEDFPITLISDTNQIKLSSLPFINIYQYKNSWDSITNNLDTKFRSGYWQKTLNRLFALFEYHETKPDEKLLHVESDVILLNNFPHKKLLNWNKLTWTRLSSDADVAAILFTPNFKASNDLAARITKSLIGKPLQSDMSVLSNVYNPESDAIFPIHKDFIHRVIGHNDKTQNAIVESIKHADFFNGSFDSLLIGKWLTGTDPRNTYGFTVLHKNELFNSSQSFFDPSSIRYKMKNSNLYIENNNKLTPIYNLHVHSKDSLLFGKFWFLKLKFLVFIAKIRKNPIYYKFNLRILIKLIYDTYKEGNLKSFITNLPILKFLKIFSNRGF